MKIIIMGCGRVGAGLAELLEAEGHEITILDTDPYSFRRLSPKFKGTALIGSGADEDTLQKAGIKEADIFIALTQGDNRNLLASQTAMHIFNVPRAICRIYDPLRAEMYRTLGLEVLSPTTIFAQMLKEQVESKGK